MAVITLLILIAFFMVFIIMRNETNQKIDRLLRQINDLKNEIKNIQLPKIESEKKSDDTTPIITEQIPELKQEQKTQPVLEEIIPEKKEKIPDEIKIEVPVIKPIKEHIPIIKSKTIKQNENLEKFIGTKLFAYIGIGITVLGIALGIKWAIDKGWINEMVRIGIGILSGLVLVSIAHILRNKYKAFSSILVGGGIALLYMTIAIGFQIYGIFTQTSAFIIMVLITGLAVALSLFYQRRELAVIAIIGGFLSPFLVSRGGENYVVLFTYIMILDVGMIILAYFKKWREINIISFIFTLILFESWLVDIYGEKEYAYTIAILFASLFYITFFLMNIINNLVRKQKFIAIEIGMIIANNCAYFINGMVILEIVNPELKGLFTVLIGIFNLGFAIFTYFQKNIDRNLVWILIALAITFITIAAPVQLNGNFIAIFWAGEAVALLWFFQKSQIKVIKIGALVVYLLMLISLITTWNDIYINRSYSDDVLPFILNKGFITSITCVTSLVISFHLLKNEKMKLLSGIGDKAFSSFIIVFLLISLFISFFLEFNYHLIINLGVREQVDVIIPLYIYAYILGVMVWSSITFKKGITTGITVIGFITCLLHLTYYNYIFFDYIDLYFQQLASKNLFVFHYIAIALLLTIIWYIWSNIKKLSSNTTLDTTVLWISVFFLIFILSSELDGLVLISSQLDNLFDQYELIRKSHQIGYPILWSSISFALMFFGIKFRLKNFRIISLTLFIITLLKLFIVDIWQAPQWGQVTALVSIGIILLVVGFMYNKLRKIIFGEDENKEGN